MEEHGTLPTPGLGVQGKRRWWCLKQAGVTGSGHPASLSYCLPVSCRCPHWKSQQEARGQAWMLSSETRSGTAKVAVALRQVCGSLVCVWVSHPLAPRTCSSRLGSAFCALLTPTALSRGRPPCRAYVFYHFHQFRCSQAAQPLGARQPARDWLPGIGFCLGTDQAALVSRGQAGWRQGWLCRPGKPSSVPSQGHPGQQGEEPPGDGLLSQQRLTGHLAVVSAELQTWLLQGDTSQSHFELMTLPGPLKTLF